MRPCLTTSSRALTLVVTTCLLLVSMTVSAQAQETAQAESLFEALNTSLSLDQRVAIFLEARKDRYLTTQDIEQVRSATYQAEDALWQVFEEIGEPPAPPPKDKSFKNYDGDALVYADSPGPTRSEASLELSQEQKLITGLYTFLETRARRELIAYLARKIGKELCEDGEMASFFVASCALLAHRKFNLVDGLHQVAREDLEHLPERLADFILARKLEELEPIACLLSTTQQGIALAQREDRSLRAYIESWVTLATHPHCQAWMSRPNVSKGPMETLVWLKLMMEDEDHLVSLAELETTLVSQLEEAMWAQLTRQHEALWRATSVSYGDVQRRFPSGIAARLAKIDEYITRLSEQDESAARDAKLEAWLDNRARVRDAAKAYERARQGAVKAYREDVMARFQATIEQHELPRLIAPSHRLGARVFEAASRRLCQRTRTRARCQARGRAHPGGDRDEALLRAAGE